MFWNKDCYAGCGVRHPDLNGIYNSTSANRFIYFGVRHPELNGIHNSVFS